MPACLICGTEEAHEAWRRSRAAPAGEAAPTASPPGDLGTLAMALVRAVEDLAAVRRDKGRDTGPEAKRVDAARAAVITWGERLTETLRLTRDGAALLVGAEEARQALEAKLREVCGGSEPSDGHDLADEVIGLLRVARSQRDAAEAEAARLRAEAEELRGALADSRGAMEVCVASENALRADRDAARAQAFEQAVHEVAYNADDADDVFTLVRVCSRLRARASRSPGSGGAGEGAP